MRFVNLANGAWSPYWIVAALCALATLSSWQILVVRGDLRLLAVVAAAALLVALCRESAPAHDAADHGLAALPWLHPPLP